MPRSEVITLRQSPGDDEYNRCLQASANGLAFYLLYLRRSVDALDRMQMSLLLKWLPAIDNWHLPVQSAGVLECKRLTVLEKH